MTAVPVAVAVVNHNTRDLLRRCLESVVREGPDDLIVVDTASTDGSPELVRREFPAIRLYEVENRGYGAGANVALAATESDLVLVLNADTRLQPGALAALAEYVASHPRAAIAGPRLVSEAGTAEHNARRFPTPLELFLQESGLHRLFMRRQGNGGTVRQVDWVLGAALAVRRDAVASVGGFDESYFMYTEEVDLCLRLRRAGWEIHYAPVATVIHTGGASTSQRRAEMTAQYVRSTAMLYRRHRSRSDYAQFVAIFAAALTARSLRDRARLLLTLDRNRRETLRTQLRAWRAAGAALRGR
jgi:N-acetylglucosaminyl-diphospho-decaprenol L-rhamnosyltransferase